MPARAIQAVGIDIGSAVTRVLALSLEGSRIRYAGHGQAPSRGWAKGRITDPRAVAESTRRAVTDAEQLMGRGAESAVVGVGGSDVDGSSMRGVYEFARVRTITREDLVQAIESASKLRLEQDRLVLMVMPQDFTLDGRSGYLNPNGARASRIEAHVQVITASLREHECLVAAVHESHLSVEETVYEPVAAAYAAVLPEERERGLIVIDIGAHSTDAAIYSHDALMSTLSIPIGGDHFSGDMAWVLKTSFEHANQLKEEFGCARRGLVNDSNLLEVPSHDGRPAREVERGHVNEILEARAEELFGYLREEVEKAGMTRQLLEGAILTGGGALLPGMLDMAERVLNCPARNGLPVGVQALPDSLMSPAWSTAAGLAMYSARLKLYRDGGTGPPGFLNLILR